MGFITTIENASATRLAVYAAISTTITIIALIISYHLDTTPDKWTTWCIMVAGVAWSLMFAIGAFLKMTMGK